MGFRFRRSIRLLPGIRINIGKRGASVSMGVRGAHITVGSTGTRTTVGVPGTGLSYTKLYRLTASQNTVEHEASEPPSRRRIRVRVLIMLFIVAAWVIVFIMRR